MDYVDHTLSNGIIGVNDEIVVIDDKVQLLNEFFKFKKDFMSEDSIIDALFEYADKHGYNYIHLTEELSEIPGFVDICKNNCIEHNFIRVTANGNIIENDWE